MTRPRRSQLADTFAFDFPVIRDYSKPSVTLHKNGRYLLIKPNDPIAACRLGELQLRMEVPFMRNTSFYGHKEIVAGTPLHVDGTEVQTIQEKQAEDWHHIELWKHLHGDVNRHPLCDMLRTYDVEIGTSPTLQNYIVKESRRRVLEQTPYPASPIVNDGVVLFGRSCPGTSLRCIKNFTPEGSDKPLFEAGNHYLVTGGGNSEGCDKIQICTEAVKKGAKIELAGAGKLYEWTELDSPMEEWFDDSENVDFGQTLDQAYPDRIKAMESRLAKLAWVQSKIEETGKHPLYEHVRVDSVMEALKRGVINCKLMRMGKSSEIITIMELWGTKKNAIVGTRNVRIAFTKEFRRLGLMDQVVFVNRLSDLEKEGKYYLFTTDWLKAHEDPTAEPRKDNENYLRAAQRSTSRKVSWDVKSQPIIIYQYNPCPHCHNPMERPILDQHFRTVKARWTTAKGYICRNPGCSWVTDNRVQEWPRRGKQKELIKGGLSHRGAAWAESRNRLVRHKPGTYVDTTLARHAQCSGDQIKGRMCLECGATDGAWQPPRYRRVKDLFSAVAGDEIHNSKADVKVTSSQNAQAMYSFRPRRRIGATGTLLSNSPLDAYWPLHWVIGQTCTQFPWQGAEGRKVFENRFCDFIYLEKPTGEIDEETGEEITKTVRKRTPFLTNPPDWWRTMQPKIVRRNYEDPLYLKSLEEAGMKRPNTEVHRTVVPMHSEQAKLMLSALRDFKKEYEKMVEDAAAVGKEVSKALVIAKMAALRTIATVPERMKRTFGDDVYTGPDGGGKIKHICALVTEAVANGKKVFIISDFVEMQLAVEKALKELGFNFIRVKSTWNDDKRIESMETLADDPNCHGVIAGTRMVREAVDYSPADVTICCDLLWSPAWQTQAWSRTLAPTPRDRNCDIYLMLSQNTLDEYIFTVFYSKMVGAEQALDRRVMNRRALDFDVKFFAQRVIEEEEALSLQIRDDLAEVIYAPALEEFEERVA